MTIPAEREILRCAQNDNKKKCHPERSEGSPLLPLSGFFVAAHVEPQLHAQRAHASGVADVQQLGVEFLQLIAQDAELLPVVVTIGGDEEQQHRVALYVPQESMTQARTAEKTKEYYDKLRGENIITSLRENKIGVSPYVYNNERDIDRLISVVTT